MHGAVSAGAATIQSGIQVGLNTDIPVLRCGCTPHLEVSALAVLCVFDTGVKIEQLRVDQCDVTLTSPSVSIEL